jgi:hypothetical protein
MVCTLISRGSITTAESAKETFTSLDPDTPLGSRPVMPVAGAAFSKAAAHTVAASPAAPTTISSPSPAKPSGRGVLSALSPFVVVAWVAGKNVVLTVYELAKE